MWWKLTITVWAAGLVLFVALASLRAWRRRHEATCPCDPLGTWPGGPCPYCGVPYEPRQQVH